MSIEEDLRLAAEAAEPLRRAAKVLRERATAFGVPEGPWVVEDGDLDWNVLAPDPAMPGLPWDVARNVGGDEPNLAAYIATMHPGVGLALADWLEDYAADCQFRRMKPNDHTLAIARLTLGDAS